MKLINSTFNLSFGIRTLFAVEKSHLDFACAIPLVHLGSDTESPSPRDPETLIHLVLSCQLTRVESK